MKSEEIRRDPGVRGDLAPPSTQSEELNVTHFGPPAAELDIRQHWVTFGWQRAVRIRRPVTGVRTTVARASQRATTA